MAIEDLMPADTPDYMARIAALLQRWREEAAKPSQGTDYDTGQYDALTGCISELHAAVTAVQRRQTGEGE